MIRTREERLEYQREYYRQHKEQLNAYSREYSKRYRNEHPEKTVEHVKRYRRSHPEKCREYMRRWREKNPEYGKKWRSEHRDMVNKRRRLIRGCDPLIRSQEKKYNRQYYILHKDEIMARQKLRREQKKLNKQENDDN